MLDERIEKIQTQEPRQLGEALINVLRNNPGLLLDPVAFLNELSGQVSHDMPSRDEIERRVLTILSQNPTAEFSHQELCFRMGVTLSEEVSVVLNALQLNKKLEITENNKLKWPHAQTN